MKLWQHNFTIATVVKLLTKGLCSESGLHSLPSRSSRYPRLRPFWLLPRGSDLRVVKWLLNTLSIELVISNFTHSKPGLRTSNAFKIFFIYFDHQISHFWLSIFPIHNFFLYYKKMTKFLIASAMNESGIPSIRVNLHWTSNFQTFL